jgi:antitoxin component YwqK of YwqJK toxin-antitoxin module
MFRWVIIFWLLLYSVCSFGQYLKRKQNQYDENGKRKGLWISYWDDEEKVPMSVARYKHGYEVGVSKEYHQNGNLRLKFRHHKKKLRVKYYDKDRKLESKGWSVIEYNETDTHYYWHGKWKFYNKKRRLNKVKWYQNGEEVSLE